jgi:DNA anti-recombination protein RmuC
MQFQNQNIESLVSQMSQQTASMRQYLHETVGSIKQQNSTIMSKITGDNSGELEDIHHINLEGVYLSMQDVNLTLPS